MVTAQQAGGSRSTGGPIRKTGSEGRHGAGRTRDTGMQGQGSCSISALLLVVQPLLPCSQEQAPRGACVYSKVKKYTHLQMQKDRQEQTVQVARQRLAARPQTLRPEFRIFLAL